MKTLSFRRFSITTHVESLQEVSLTGWIVIPEELYRLSITEQPVPLLFCIPGGSYTKDYWHMEVPGFDSDAYSFAHYMAKRGNIVVAIDNLGTGESTIPDDGLSVTATISAQANHQVLLSVKEQLADGSLLGIKVPHIFTIGVGHSMGAFLAMVQQDHYKSFEALALLGWTNDDAFAIGGGTSSDKQPQQTASVDGVVNRFADKSKIGYIRVNRQHAANVFYHSFVPEVVRQADLVHATHIPYGILQSMAHPGQGASLARQVSVPIFLGFGEVDISPSPRLEPNYYQNTTDITIISVPGVAHIHNLSENRFQLWNRLGSWCQEVAVPEEVFAL